MSEGFSDSEDTMGVVVGDKSEGDKEDAILIPDHKCDPENIKKNKFSLIKGVAFMSIGAIIFSMTVLVWITTFNLWDEEIAGPVVSIIIGIFVFFHGLIAYFQPPEIYSLEVVLNGTRSTSILPLRHILVCLTNTICGITGIITMCTLGPYYWWPAWNIIGLFLSILTLLVTLISALACYPKTSKMINSRYFNYHGANIKETVAFTGKLILINVELFTKLLPLPSVQSLNNLGNVLKEPRLTTNKPVHVLSILLAMVACIVMFVAQLWDIAIARCHEGQTCYFYQDPDGTFARTWLMYGIIGGHGTPDRKIVILVSLPITFLLCTTLLLLMKGTTVLRMILSGLISLGMGVFFFLFSIDAAQYIILLGTKMSGLSFVLKLVSLMPIPLLAALFMALAYSNIIQMMEKKEDDRSSKLKTGLLSISIILAIVFFVLSLASMVTSNLVMMSTVQGHWGYGCQENEYHNCYDKDLDYKVQNDFTWFAISQVLLTESFLLLSILMTLTGRRITKKSLFFPGLLLFTAALLTIMAFFSGINQYDLKMNGILFLILNSASTLSALILGFICVVSGGNVFISFITILGRVILSIFVFAFLVILTSIEAVLKLSSLIRNNMEESKVEVVDQPEVTTA